MVYVFFYFFFESSIVNWYFNRCINNVIMFYNKKILEGIILKFVYKFFMVNKCKDIMKWILLFISIKLGVLMVCKFNE